MAARHEGSILNRPTVPESALVLKAASRRLDEITESARGGGHTSRAQGRIEGGDTVSSDSIDDDLARLVYDSASHSEPSDLGLRRLTFQAAELSLHVELRQNESGELVCSVMPPQPARLQMISDDGAVTVLEDSRGTFRLVHTGVALRKLRLSPLNCPTVVVSTSWLNI